MTEFRFTLSEDRRSVRLSVRAADPEAVTLSQADLDALIVRLAQARVATRPARAMRDLRPDDPVHVSPRMRWSVGIPGGNPHRLLLALLHPGLGWVMSLLDLQQATRLHASLTIALSRMAQTQ